MLERKSGSDTPDVMHRIVRHPPFTSGQRRMSDMPKRPPPERIAHMLKRGQLQATPYVMRRIARHKRYGCMPT